jgi:outer membrane lipoprotein carrier protein
MSARNRSGRDGRGLLPAGLASRTVARISVRRRQLVAASGASIVLLGLPRPAQASTAIEQLRAFLKDTGSARGEFTQRVTSRSQSAGQVSSGSFVFQRPGRFRWVYQKPYEQVIVADGERMFLYDKDLNQVTVRALAGAIPASPASILFGAGQFDKDFTLRDGGSRDGLDWVSATPRAGDTPFEKIEIGMGNGLPAAMLLTDSFGQTTLLRFTRFERNVGVDPQTFRFTPPPGADVLESR